MERRTRTRRFNHVDPDSVIVVQIVRQKGGANRLKLVADYDPELIADVQFEVLSPGEIASRN